MENVGAGPPSLADRITQAPADEAEKAMTRAGQKTTRSTLLSIHGSRVAPRRQFTSSRGACETEQLSVSNGCGPGIQRMGMFVTRKAEFSASHVCRLPRL